MSDTHGLPKYNELHFSPILQHLSGIFVAIDDSKNIATNIVVAKKLFTTLKNVMEILFVSPGRNTEANFNSLEFETKESFKKFFNIKGLLNPFLKNSEIFVAL